MVKTTLTIEGFDECMKAFEKAPERGLKVSRQCMRKGLQAATKAMKSRTPTRWKGLAKYKAGRSRDGKFSGFFGLINGHQRQGHQNPKGEIDDWFKAYWSNYGTLEGRDPGHEFQYPVKHRNTAAAANRRGQGGIQHQNFFETAIDGVDEVFMEAFEQEFDSNLDKIFND